MLLQNCNSSVITSYDMSHEAFSSLLPLREVLGLPIDAALRELTREELWGQQCSNTKRKKVGEGATEKETVEAVRLGLLEDGFVALKGHNWDSSPEALAVEAHRLDELGYPATFLLMNEEAWKCVSAASKIISGVSSDPAIVLNLDILAWRIDPRKGQSGFSPHRDRQPADVRGSFTASGVPRYITCWLALTEASPSNSCLFMLPRGADPGYEAGDQDDIDPLLRALPQKECYQRIRAFPLSPGEAVIFSHRTIHWGSVGCPRHTGDARVSLAMAFSDEQFEHPYFSSEYLPVPPMHLRLALVCGQMICYHERFSFDGRTLIFFKRVFDQWVSLFHTSYRQKVSNEFVAAAKEREAASLSTISTQLPQPAANLIKPDKLNINKPVRGKSAVKLSEPKTKRNSVVSVKRKRSPAQARGGRSRKNSIEESSNSCDESDDGGFFAATGSAIGYDEDDLMEAALEEMLQNEDCGKDDFDDEDENLT